MDSMLAPCVVLVLTTATSDGGLPASKLFSRVHPKLGLPLNALVLTSVVVILFGLLFLASTR